MEEDEEPGVKRERRRRRGRGGGNSNLGAWLGIGLAWVGLGVGAGVFFGCREIREGLREGSRESRRGLREIGVSVNLSGNVNLSRNLQLSLEVKKKVGSSSTIGRESRGNHDCHHWSFVSVFCNRRFSSVVAVCCFSMTSRSQHGEEDKTSEVENWMKRTFAQMRYPTDFKFCVSIEVSRVVNIQFGRLHFSEF